MNGWRTRGGQFDGSKYSFANYSRDGAQVVGTTFDRVVEICDVDTGLPILLIPLDPNGHVRSARFSHDGKYIVTASTDGYARLWTTGPLQRDIFEVTKFDVHAPVDSISFSFDGKRIIGASEDGMVRIFDVGRYQAAIEFARKHPPRTLTEAEEEKYFLLPEKQTA